MENRRFSALQEVLHRKPIEPVAPGTQISEYYGSNVFGYDAMKEFLREEAFLMLMNDIEKGSTIDRKIADKVASAMKSCETTKGAHTYPT